MRCVKKIPFDSNENDWPIGTEMNDYVENDWMLFRGKYRWEAQAAQDVQWYIHPDIKSLGDFYLSTEVRKISGPVDCSYGVVFRVKDDNNFYEFGISDTQYFSIYRKFRGNWETLVNWRYSAAIQPDEVNRLAIVAQGGHFVFWINDQLVTEVDDNHIASGRNGLTMTLFNPGDQAVFEFDNFEVREP